MEFNEKFIYFDNNATTPIDERVFDAMLPFLKEKFANPSSAHHFGNLVNESINKARISVADLIGAEQQEIIFTSGSTEAINIAMKGVAENYTSKGKHIITVSTEHPAVLDTCKHLEGTGCEITYLSVNKDGLIDLKELKNSLRNDTILVSVMYVNNETGVIQPIREIATLAHSVDALYFCDATQAAGRIEIDVDSMGIDLLCISGHKMYAPKGIGALYVRQRNKSVKLATYIHGGGHEKGLRSGTLNVPGIVALAKACEIARLEMNKDSQRISLLLDELEIGLLKISGAYVNGSREMRIHNVTNICFPHVDAEIIIGRMKNIALSNGSACNAAVVEPSHVLKAMGSSDDDAFASIRFSLGRFNSLNEVRTVIRNIALLIEDNYRYA